MMKHEPDPIMSDHENTAASGLASKRINRVSGWLTVLPSLLTPVCAGLACYFLLAWAIKEGHITDELTLRYLTGHAVSKVTLGMFFVGACSLALIAYNIFEQFSSEAKIGLEELPEQTSAGSVRGIEEEANCAVDHGQQLMDMPRWTHTHYLWNRLVHTLHYIYRTGAVSGVEDEMKYLAEMDLDRSHQRYALVRILIWATPMLGFLGTVLGISQALGGISVGPDNDFQAMMGGLQSNLYVAFDTTALALTLSIVLMFAQFLIERFETQLLELVDQRTRREISEHYDLTLSASTQGGFDKIGREVLEATRAVVVDQTTIWKKTIAAAEQAWSSSLTQTSDLVRGQLGEALDENVANLADYLGQAIEKADLSVANRWEQWQTMLSENARLMRQHQEQMIAQTKNVHALVDKMDDSSSFKEALAQQDAAIEATTHMHEVLTRVANEMAAQGQQIEDQSAAQAELAIASAQLLKQSQTALDQQSGASRTDGAAAPKTNKDVAVNADAPAKPVASAKPVAMGAVERTAPGKESTTAEVKPSHAARSVPKVVKPRRLPRVVSTVVRKTPATPSPASEQTPAKASAKANISISAIKQQAGLSEKSKPKPDAIMPDPKRMEERRRARQQAGAVPMSIPFVTAKPTEANSESPKEAA